MTTFLVKSQLKHDGDLYPVDSSIELDNQTAKKLLADGVIAKIPNGPAKTGKEPANLGAAKKASAKTGKEDETKEEEKSDADNL